MYSPIIPLDRGGFLPSTIRKRLSKQKVRHFLYLFLLMLDFFVVLCTPMLLSLATYFEHRQDLLFTPAVLPVYFAVAVSRDAYSLTTISDISESVRRAIGSLFVAQLSILIAVLMLNQSEEVPSLSFVFSALSTVFALAVTRAVYVLWVRHLMHGAMLHELVLLDGVDLDVEHERGCTASAQQLNIQPDLNDPQMLHRFGKLAAGFDKILIASVPERQAAWSILLKGANVEGELIVHGANDVGALGIGKFYDRETLLVSRRRLSVLNRALKRSLDIVLAVPLLIAFMPIFAVIALLIKLEDGGPIFFRQDRVGRGNCQFKIIKFRSMRADQGDATGVRSASRNDDRITYVGRFIRATSIDELPQLFNVLVGEMSLVGPRPHALGSLAGDRLFWEIDQTYWHRHQIKPGVTGLAQVRGFRGATLQTSDLVARLQADMEYLQGWTIWRDLWILVSTLGVVKHKNAY